MTSKKTEVVFRRPKAGFEENDPENWDDSAITKAYDSAVKKLNNAVASQKSNSSGDAATPKRNMMKKEGATASKASPLSHEKNQNCIWTRSQQSGKKIESKHNGNEELQGTKWKNGDSCVAIYYEDGLYYHATVKYVNTKSNSCVVEYEGYGNRETVHVQDMHTTEDWDKTQKQKDPNSEATLSKTSETSTSTLDTTSTSSALSTDETSSDVMQDIYRRHGNKKKSQRRKSKQRRSSDSFYPPFPPTYGFSPFFMPPPPFLGGAAPAFPNGKLSKPSEVESNLPDLSNDALSSMLMSWYMAGYQTGYYQGLNAANPRRNKRKNSKH